MIRLPGSYLFFLSGLFISRIGDSLYTLAIPWISYELTQSALVMSSVYAVSVLPIVLFGPVIGVLVDHLPRKKLMMATDLAGVAGGADSTDALAWRVAGMASVGDFVLPGYP